MQRANGSEREGGGAAVGAAEGSQQEGGLRRRQRDAPLPELLDQAPVMAADTAGRVGQAEIEIEERLPVDFKIVGHGRPFGSFSWPLRLPSGFPACGRNRLPGE